MVRGGFAKMEPTSMDQQLLRLPQVREATGLGRSTIYALVAARKFPQPVKPTEGTSAWVSAEIRDWIAARIEQSRRVAV
jgi:prophage regulatory protein